MRTLKYSLRTILFTCVMVCSVSSVHAYDFEVNGIYYMINGNNATVTYKDYNYNSYGGEVIIPETVTYNGVTYSVKAIGYEAFMLCAELTDIILPSSITSIGYHSFYECTGLKSIVIPNSVVNIDDAAFQSCTGLEYITMGNSVQSIGVQAFSSCQGLSSIVIPNSVVTIGSCAFEGCSGLANINLPNSVTTIGDGAFSNCSSLTSIMIPNSVSFIGNWVFQGCNGITSMVVENGNPYYDSRNNSNAIIETANNRLISGCQNTIIPNTVISIGDGAFYYCENLSRITIPNSVKEIGLNAFSGCSAMTDLVLSNSVTSIGHGAFSGCSNLTSVEIPNSITSIEGEVFQECRGLTQVIIPNSVTSIGDYAFSNCSGLTSITIPKSVITMGSDPFFYCNNLNSICVENGNPSYDSRDSCDAIIETSSNTLIFGCKNTKIPKTVTSIGNGAFVGCDKLKNLCIPNSITSIGSRAFSGSGLTSITIPSSVTSIGESAFSTIKLKNVTCLAPNPPVIQYYAFPTSVNDNTTLHVPHNSLEAYQSAAYWKLFKSIIDDAVEVDSIVISRNSIHMCIENQFTLTATLMPENPVPNEVVWISSDDGVATVNDGVITAVAYGECQILAICQNQQAVCHVVVVNPDEEIKGDVNGDGAVSIADVTALIDLLLSK